MNKFLIASSLLIILLLNCVSGYSQIIINPGTGNCDASRSGLRINISTNGSFDVWYGNVRETYSNMQTYFRIGGTSTALTACSSSPVSGSGTEADPYVVLLTYQMTVSGSTYTITQKISYVLPNRYFMMDFEVIADGNPTTDDIDIILVQDTAPGGDDYGYGYVNNSTNPTIVAGYRTALCSSTRNAPSTCAVRAAASIVYKTSSSGFTSYYSSSCCTATGYNTGMLNNAVASSCVDHYIGVHWRLSALSAWESKTKRLMVGFGDTYNDFNSVVVADQPNNASGSRPVDVSFTSASFSTLEGDVDHYTSDITVSVSGGILNAPQSIKISAANGTAISGTDFVLDATAFVIPADNYSTPKTVTISNLIKIKGNTVIQNNRNFTLTLDPSTCGALARPANITSATVTIIDDDVPTVSLQKVADISSCGSSTNIFKVNLSKACPDQVIVNFDLSGSASVTPADFSASVPSGWYTSATTGSVTIPANTTSLNVYLTATGNNIIFEPAKVLDIRISSATRSGNAILIAASPSDRASVSVVDCDNTASNKVITISAAPTTINELPGAAPNSSTVTLKLPGNIVSTTATRVNINYTGGTATYSNDFSITNTGNTIASSGYIEIPANQNFITFTVNALPDDIIEGNETVNIVGSLGTTETTNGFTVSGAPVITIVDATGTAANKQISISVDENTINELPGSTPNIATITVKLPGTIVSASAVRVNLAYSGTASTSDYSLQPTTTSTYIDIPQNQNRITFTLSALQDNFLEGDENVKITPTAPTGFTINPSNNEVSIIIKDKTPGDVIVEKTLPASGNAMENPLTHGQFIIRFKDANVTAVKPVVVTYTVSGTAVATRDYQTITPASPVTITTGNKSVNIPVNVINNFIVDGNRTVDIKITNVTW